MTKAKSCWIFHWILDIPCWTLVIPLAGLLVCHVFGLPGASDHVQPEHAFVINQFSAANRQGNGNMGELVIPVADQHAGLPCHSGVNGVLGQLIAINAKKATSLSKYKIGLNASHYKY